MPTFHIRAWMTQTLIDEATYRIDAPTKEEAARKLNDLLARAADHGWQDTRTGTDTPDDFNSIDAADRPYIVTALDPDEVIESERGFDHITEDGELLSRDITFADLDETEPRNTP